MALRTPSPVVPSHVAGAPWTDRQLDQVERAWATGDEHALAELSGELGVVLTIDALGRLDAGRRKLGFRQVLAAISGAVSSDHGLGLCELSDFMYTGVCLAVVADQRMTATFGHASNARTSVGKLFEPLRPWQRELGRNRARIEAWLAKPTSQDSRVELPCVARAAVAAPTEGEQALRAAICAAPDDPQPRAVLADLLIQRGDPHGELITLQLQVGDNFRDPAFAAHRQRIGRLHADHGPRICGEVAQHAREYRIKRGFVEQVTMSAATFKTHGERLLSQHPIIRLTPRPVTEEAFLKLAKVPALARIRELEIEQDIGDERVVGLSLLLKSPHLTSLRWLSLRNLRAPDWVEAFTALNAPALTHVQSSGGDSSLAAFSALLKNPRVPSLARLEIDHFLAQLESDRFHRLVTEDRTGVTAFTKALAARASLRELHFTGYLPLRPDDWAAIFTGPVAEGLTVLSVQHAPFGDAHLEAIGAKPRALRSLDLSGTKVANGLSTFLRSTAAAQLERLIMYSNDLSQEERGRVDDVLAKLPATHPLKFVGGLARQPRYLDANVTDHPELASG